ncbi:hypothetical protein Nos7524_0512 [Nostoc sp. PCC 7524]|nr:hypothetical protein Nos7524_0512 [Nostoc sp. PCC 7524]
MSSEHGISGSQLDGSSSKHEVSSSEHDDLTSEHGISSSQLDGSSSKHEVSSSEHDDLTSEHGILSSELEPSCFYLLLLTKYPQPTTSAPQLRPRFGETPARLLACA